MTLFIACFVAGVTTTGFVSIWFITVYKEIIHLKHSVADLSNQVQMHKKLFLQARGGPDETTSQNMLDNSRYIYDEAVKSYNSIILKPMNRFPAWIMGFKIISNEQ